MTRDRRAPLDLFAQKPPSGDRPLAGEAVPLAAGSVRPDRKARVKLS